MRNKNDDTYFRIALPDETVARLIEVCEEAHCDPREMIAALVIGVLEDDFEAHHSPVRFTGEEKLH